MLPFSIQENNISLKFPDTGILFDSLSIKENLVVQC